MRLLGLDFGSTTSSMMLAEVHIGRHSLNGRMGFSEPTILQQTTPVFTPFDGKTLDQQAMASLLDQWLQDADWNPSQQAAGAALITGLAARADNAHALSQAIRQRIENSLIAVADDPGLESWLAFMGSCATLSRAHPQRAVINMDIGGGTTNPAKGVNGQVTDCGCFYIGARHLMFQPGTYQLTACSHFGSLLLQYLRIHKSPGQTLTDANIHALVTFCVTALESIAMGDMSFFQRSPFHQRLMQMPFSHDMERGTHPLISFSGGVGELIYRYRHGFDWPTRTLYGDLGIDLAKAIVASPVLSADLSHPPEHAGRATVMGLTLHSSDVSGSSLYLSDPGLLPLNDLPIIARLSAGASPADWQRAVTLAKGSRQGACIGIENSHDLTASDIKQLGQTLGFVLNGTEYPLDQPLVLLLDTNLGKTLGQYITDWGKQPRSLFVIDEIPVRDARFVQIGRSHQHIVPVSFFGMN